MSILSNLPAATAQTLDGMLEDFARKHHIPGLMFGLVAGGALIWSKAIGLADREGRRPVTVDTRFRIASMTKNTTALAILMLRDAGKVALDAPAATYVPELAKLPLPTADSAPITLRDLLTHSAGLVTDDPWGDRQLGIAPADFTRMLRDGALFARPPRIAFEYSNLGYAILGRVITNVTGRRYQDFIGESILRPLGMQATGFDFHAAPEAERATGYRWAHESWSPEQAETDGEFGAMGGLLTSAADYARYVAFLLSAWPPRDTAETGPAKRATVRELGAAHSFPLAATTREAGGKTLSIASAYGYGMVSSLDPALGRTIHHRGGLPGYGSHFVISPDTGIGLFTFANVTYAEANDANLQAALVLHEADLWKPRVPAVSPALAAAVDFAVRAYATGKIDESSPLLAVNLLPDEPAADRNAKLAALKAKLGEVTQTRIEAQHDLAGRFTATCAKGTLSGTITLTPGPRPGIQTLEFEKTA
ncbi:MAG TPA: serine hydrolase domain-containing protein [Dongiaceae bacterium]|nr:serine hydrolase domain-containing protein [Dongiaceae bacterium]